MATDYRLPLVERLEGGVVEGSRGYRDWIANNDASWETWETTITQVLALDADRVLVETVFKAISKRGGVPVEQPIAGIITVREGKVVRSELFGSRADALEAVGMRE